MMEICNILYSKLYGLFYIGMIVLNVALIFWLIGSAIAEKKFVPPQSNAFLALEIIVNIVLIVEILIRACSQGKKYFGSKANLFDFGIMLLCILALGIYPITALASVEYRSFTVILMGVRYAAQLLRLVLMINNQRVTHKQQTANTAIIDLNKLDAEEEKNAENMISMDLENKGEAESFKFAIFHLGNHVCKSLFDTMTLHGACSTQYLN